MNALLALRLSWLLACCWGVAASAAISEEASLSAARKFQRLAAGEVPSGESVELQQDEMNAFLRYHAAPTVPDSISDLEIKFREGGAVVRAEVDLEKAGESLQDLPVLMRFLLRGTRRIALDVDFAGERGLATTALVLIEIDGVELSGTVLEWFLQSFAPPELAPYLTGEPARLPPGVAAVRIRPGIALIVAE